MGWSTGLLMVHGAIILGLAIVAAQVDQLRTASFSVKGGICEDW